MMTLKGSNGKNFRSTLRLSPLFKAPTTIGALTSFLSEPLQREMLKLTAGQYLLARWCASEEHDHNLSLHCKEKRVHQGNCTCLGNQSITAAEKWSRSETSASTRKSNAEEFNVTTAFAGGTQSSAVRGKTGPVARSNGQKFSVAAVISYQLALFVPHQLHTTAASKKSTTSGIASREQDFILAAGKAAIDFSEVVMANRANFPRISSFPDIVFERPGAYKKMIFQLDEHYEEDESLAFAHALNEASQRFYPDKPSIEFKSATVKNIESATNCQSLVPELAKRFFVLLDHGCLQKKIVRRECWQLCSTKAELEEPYSPIERRLESTGGEQSAGSSFDALESATKRAPAGGQVAGARRRPRGLHRGGAAEGHDARRLPRPAALHGGVQP